MARTIYRCTGCRSAKGQPHKPFCKHRNNRDSDLATIYVPSIESSHTDTSSSSCTDTPSGGDCG